MGTLSRVNHISQLFWNDRAVPEHGQMPYYCHGISGIVFGKSFELELLKTQLYVSTQILSWNGMSYFPVL